MENQNTEFNGKYSQTYEFYCTRHPLLCHRCNTVNASFLSAAINKKNWFTIKVYCHSCEHCLTKGPYSIEELKMLARMTSRERHFDLAYIWHCFLMLSEHPEKLESPSMVLKYRLWRATILAEVRKHAPSYESLWGKGGENALRPA